MRPVSALLVSSFLVLVGGFAAPAFAVVADPTAVATCQWNHISDADKADMAAGYHDAATDLANRLGKLTGTWDTKKAAFEAAYAQCDPTPNVPKNWIGILAVAQAIRVNAAAELLAAPHHITQTQLDHAWWNAPDASTKCVFGNAIATFNLPKEPCPDAQSIIWFPVSAGLDIHSSADRPEIDELLIYINATAQEYLAISLIKRFKAESAQSDTKPQ